MAAEPSELPKRSSSRLRMRSLGSDQSNKACDFDFTIKLVKSGDGIFGLAYRQTADVLIITAIMPQSSAWAWNRLASTKETICVGDQIVSVNGEMEWSLCLEELTNSEEVEMVLRPLGPRWHLATPDVGAGAKYDALKIKMFRKEVDRAQSIRVAREANVNTTKQVEKVPITLVEFAFLFLSVFVPCAICNIMVSDMGFGIAFFNMFADTGEIIYKDPNAIGNGIICFSCGIGVLLYVFDWKDWQLGVFKVLSALSVVYVICAGIILKSKYYPQAPMLLVLFHIPVFLGMLRVSLLKNTKRRSFYLSVSLSTATVAVLLLIIFSAWVLSDAFDGRNSYNAETKTRLASESKDLYSSRLVQIEGVKRPLIYEWDCDEYDLHKTNFDWVKWKEKGVLVDSGHRLTAVERDERAQACARVKTTWFLVWFVPIICITVLSIVSAFCMVNAALIDDSSLDASKIEKVLKNFVLMVAIMVLSMWVAASMAGASMRLTGTLMAFSGAGFVALSIWLYIEIGTSIMSQAVRTSRLTKMILGLLQSDWVRAMTIIGFNMLIPSFLLVDMLQQRVRVEMGKADKKRLFTPGVYALVMVMSRWNWSNILSKCNLWVVAYWTLSVGVAKVTYIFLSWLNNELMKVDLHAVILIFFLVGYTMFLLPPVPGIPVYLCSGILISARAAHVESVGRWGGVLIAVLVSYILKLAAVCGQYLIGYCLGKSVKVQQLVGVDKTFTRAIEKILMTPGLNLPKISVLVGAPDWPTSVLCGILRLNLFQCVLGTLPVIVVSAPCVLAGAFMSMPSDGIAGTLNSLMMAISGIMQMASGILALYYIQECIDQYSDVLQHYRKEHEPVAELTRQEAHYNSTLEKVSNFRVLPRHLQMLLLTATALNLLCLFMFMFMDEVCFRPFQVNNDMYADHADGGLNGDVFSIVRIPGKLAHVMFLVACSLFLVYSRLITGLTKVHIAENSDS